MFYKKEKPSFFQELVTNKTFYLVLLTVSVVVITYMMLRRKYEDEKQMSHLELMKQELLDIETRLEKALRCLEQYVSQLE